MAGELVDPGLGGAVRTMWRSVYRKAAEVAEARARELLRDHVYQYPHSAGGGAGGGGWVLLAEIGPLTVTTLSPLAFSAIPQDAVHLWLHFEGRGTGSAVGTLGVQLNADTGDTNYAWSQHYVMPSATHAQRDVGLDNHVRVADLVRGTQPAAALTTADVYVPHYAKNDARYQRVVGHAQSDNVDGSGNDFPELYDTVGVWKSGAPVTAVRFFAFTGSTNFAAGTHVQLYGLSSG